MSMLALFSKPPTYAGGPIIDGQVVTRNPQEAFIRGEAAKVPLIIGTTSQDLPALFPPDRTKPLEYFGPEAEKARSIYDPNGNAPVPALLAAIAVDMTMHEPARFVAKQMTVRGNPVWLYRFDYVAESLRPKVTGAEHASELPYMFNTLDTRYGKDATEKDRAMGRAFHSYFANFVKGGDPNGQGLPNWSKYDSAKSDIMQLTMDNGAVMEADPWKERLDLVEHVADTQTTTQSETAGLGGTTWQLVKFQGGDDRTLVPDDKSKYTIVFGNDGRVAVRLDCNRGGGTWKSAGSNQLQFGPLALTRAMCPPGSLHDRIVRDWTAVRSYVIKGDHLFLSLMADGGIYEFEPLGGSPP